MQPNKFISALKEYPLASHKAWEQPNKRAVLKLDWNESDLNVPFFVKWAILKFVLFGQLNWYPDIANKKLTAVLAKYMNIDQDNVQYFSGEDSALDYIVRTFAAPGDTLGLVAPTYDNFRVFVESVGAVPHFLLSDEVFGMDIDLLMSKITSDMKMVYLVNPNNPTGILYSSAEIERLLRHFPETLFIIDEAYGEFAGVTATELTKSYKNILVCRSLSKAFGLASIRLGYVITDAENLSHINKIRNGKNISAVAQVAAISALSNPTYMHRYVREVREARTLLCEQLEKLGFVVQETSANFLLIKVSDVSHFCTTLQRKNIFVRSLGHLQGMEEYVRITVGTKKTVQQFIDAVQNAINHGELTVK